MSKRFILVEESFRKWAKDPEFKRVLGNLLKAPPKPHSEMKIEKLPRKKGAKKKDVK